MKKITNIQKIKIIDTTRFSINLLTAILFIYLAYDLNRPISMTIGWLLLLGWMLGAYERRLLAIRRKYRRERREKERREMLKLNKYQIELEHNRKFVEERLK